MVESTAGNSATRCKDQDGVLPIRREAWKLIAPMPSTTGSQSTPGGGTNPAIPVSPPNNLPPVGNVPLPGAPLPVPALPPQQGGSTSPTTPPNPPQLGGNVGPSPQQGGNFGPGFGGPTFPGGQFPFDQGQFEQYGAPQPCEQFPMMVPIYWYYPQCQQCQQFGPHYYR